MFIVFLLGLIVGKKFQLSALFPFILFTVLLNSTCTTVGYRDAAGLPIGPHHRFLLCKTELHWMDSTLDNERFRKLLQVHPWQALHIVYEQYYTTLLCIAVRFIRDPDAAHDIVHDTFLTVWDGRKSIAQMHEKSIEHYLARVVRNKSVSYYRRKRHLDIDLLMLFTDFASEDNTEQSQIEHELYLDFRQFIDALPLRQRQAIVMRIDRSMTLDEIAIELGVSRKMVENSQTKALKKLRKWAEGKR